MTPAYLRARLSAIRKLINELPIERDEKNPDRTLVRNGVIPESQLQRYNELFDDEYKIAFSNNEPLTFTEITSFNTWFAMQPEKVCGKEVITTSREFPITIKGSKEDIINTITSQLNLSDNDNKISQSQFQNDTQNIEIETEITKSKNRFGKAENIINKTVQDFHSFYYDVVTEFLQIKAPIEKEISEISKQSKDKAIPLEKRKELTAKLSDAIQNRNRLQNEFDTDWWDFCGDIREIIIKTAIDKGLDIGNKNDSLIADDIMLAFNERPGIEYYWDTTIEDVINKELDYFARNQNNDNEMEVLALEALALETELKLLTI